MNKRLLAIFALILVIVGGAFFFLRGGASDAGDGEAATDDRPNRAAIIEKKMAARQAGAIDMSPATIGGTVSRASDGKGVQNAVVLLNRKSLDQGGATEPGQPNQPLSVVTDASGQWTMPSVAPGRYTLSATAPGFLPAANDKVVLAAASERKDLDLTLEAGGHTLSGVVTDIGGGPVESVLMTVTDMEGSGLFGFRQASYATLTDEQGGYGLQLPNGGFVITTYHPDYVTNFKMTTIQDGPRTEDLKITPAGVIEGVVLSRQDETPVGAARVVFNDGRSGQQNQDFRSNMSGGGMPLVTDDAGRFRLTGLHPGVVKLSAFAPGFASNESTDVPLGIGEELSGVEVYVERAYKIAGFVVPRDSTDDGVEGVLVGAFSIQPPSLIVAHAPSASDGYFEIQGVRPGNYMVGAIGENVLPNIMGNSAVVTNADVTDMLIEMDTGVHVTGQVAPAGVAKVKLKLDMDEFSMGKMVETVTNSMAKATANADGTFDLGPINPGTFTLVATNANGDRGELEVTVGEDGLDGVVLEMKPRASLAGRVVDEGGVPQAGMRVEVTPVKKGGGPQVNMDFGNPFGTGTPTGEDGSFTARGLEPGPHTIVVKSSKGRVLAWAQPEDPSSPTAPIEAEIEAMEQRTGFDLIVEARNGEITGIVVDADGLPATDVWVTASEQMSAVEFGRSFSGADSKKDEEGVRVAVTVGGDGDDDDEDDDFDVPAFFSEPPVLTDENGRFVIKELRSDRAYLVVAEGEKGGARARETDVSPGADLSLNLEALAGIRGKVTRSGKAVSSYRVEIDGPNDRQKSVFAEDGSFVIDRIDPGEYEIRVTSDAGVATAEATVETGATTDVAIELEDWGTITGQVVAVSNSEPISGLFVMVVPEKGGPDAAQALAMFTGGGTKTDRKGKFEVGKVGPGKGQVVFLDRDAAMSAGGAVASEKYEIEPGQDLDLGTIKGVPASDVPKDERGDLGFGTTIASMAKRPQPPGTEVDETKPGAEEAEEEEDAERHLWVLSIKDGGPADEAGLEPADQILSIDGQDVSAMGPGNARSMLSKAHVRAGQTIKLQVEREGSKHSISVTASEPADAVEPPG